MPASSQGRTRLTETAVALLIGFAVSLSFYSTASASAVTIAANVADLTSVSGALGGFVAALVHFAGMALTPPAVGSGRNTVRALVEGSFSVLVGGIVAHYLAVPVAAGLPWVPVTSAPVAGFGIGVFAWQAAPGVIGGVKLFATPKNIAREIGAWLVRKSGPPGDGQ
jgi:hypothetical protein